MRAASLRIAAKRYGLDLESEARGKTNGTQQPKLIFFEAFLRSADRAYKPGIKIIEAADVVKNSDAKALLVGKELVQAAAPTQRVQQQAVDGEVAALHVFCRSLRVTHLIGWRPSEYTPSERNVATSVVHRSSTVPSLQASLVSEATRTTPKCAPTAKVRGNMPRTMSGVAEVATS